MSALWRPAYRVESGLGWRVISPAGCEPVLLFPVREICPSEHPRGGELSGDPSCRDPSPAPPCPLTDELRHLRALIDETLPQLSSGQYHRVLNGYLHFGLSRNCRG